MESVSHEYSSRATQQIEQAIASVTRSRLANGLGVWAQERPGTGTVALAMRIKVGSRYETRANNGISHFLEHMLFNGTERWSESEIMDVVRSRGGSANAHTGPDETVVYLHIDATHLPLAIEWIRQLVFNPVLPADKVDKERNVIVNEKGGAFGGLRRVYEWIEERQLGWNVGRAVLHRLFPDSSVLLPVIGTDASLQAIDHAALLNHYHTYYVPGNMTLAVVGDFDMSDLQVRVSDAFGSIPDAEPAPPAPDVVFSAEPFSMRLRGPAPNEQGQFLLGATLGPEDHSDRYAWWVLAELLERAFVNEIRFSLGLSYDVNVSIHLYPEGGYLTVYTQTEVDNFDMVREVINREIARVMAGEFVENELADTIAGIRGRTLLSIQSNLDLVWWYLAEDSLVGIEREIPDFFAGLTAVDAAAVQRVARDYLSEDRRFNVVHSPVITPRRIQPWALGTLAAVLAGVAAWRSRNRAV